MLDKRIANYKQNYFESQHRKRNSCEIQLRGVKLPTVMNTWLPSFRNKKSLLFLGAILLLVVVAMGFHQHTDDEAHANCPCQLAKQAAVFAVVFLIISEVAPTQKFVYAPAQKVPFLFLALTPFRRGPPILL